MTGFVLDASAALGWLVDNPPSAYAMRIQRRMVDGARPVVPIHWRLEIANAVLSAARRKSLRRQASDVIGDISALMPFIEQDVSPDDLGTLVSLGQRLQLTACDAAYIALAVRRGLALATEDKAMLAAARTLKIVVLS